MLEETEKSLEPWGNTKAEQLNRILRKESEQAFWVFM